MLAYEHEAYPLAYLYLQKYGEEETRKSAIEKFLRVVQERNVNLLMFATNKEERRIDAIRKGFPQCTIFALLLAFLKACERKMGSISLFEKGYFDGILCICSTTRSTTAEQMFRWI